MKTVKCIYCDMKKSIYSPSFLVCIITTFLLSFTACCFTNPNNIQYSIFRVMTTFSHKQIMGDPTFSAISIFKIGGGSWLSMFIPIVAAFPFIPVFCDERSSGNIRFSISRAGNFRYNFSKFCSAFFSGGLAVMIGYALFGIIIGLYFPKISSYNAEQVIGIIKSNVFVTVLQQLIQMFLFGAVSSLLAFAISSFVHNKYLIMCIPFMLKYIYDQTVLKMYINAGRTQNLKLAEKLDIFNSNRIATLFSQDKNFWWIILLNFILMIVCFGFFNFFMNRRLDLGA